MVDGFLRAARFAAVCGFCERLHRDLWQCSGTDCANAVGSPSCACEEANRHAPIRRPMLRTLVLHSV